MLGRMCPTRKNTKIRESWFGTSNAFERLVGGFNPSEKYWSKRIISPTMGENKQPWDHNLAHTIHVWCIYLNLVDALLMLVMLTGRRSIDRTYLPWVDQGSPHLQQFQQDSRRVFMTSASIKNHGKKRRCHYFFGGMSIILKLPDCYK